MAATGGILPPQIDTEKRVVLYKHAVLGVNMDEHVFPASRSGACHANIRLISLQPSPPSVQSAVYAETYRPKEGPPKSNGVCDEEMPHWNGCFCLRLRRGYFRRLCCGANWKGQRLHGRLQLQPRWRFSGNQPEHPTALQLRGRRGRWVHFLLARSGWGLFESKPVHLRWRLHHWRPLWGGLRHMPLNQPRPVDSQCVFGNRPPQFSP